MLQSADQDTAATQHGAARPFWPEGWWRLMEFRIGVIPLPVYVITLAVIVILHQNQGELFAQVLPVVMLGSLTNRMQLMPFAQIATRIGGAITVTLALVALGRLA